MRIIAHIDMDAFYAAVEERHHPELRGRPVVVGADPKEGKGRGVVTAANYAARKYGIRSALPISRAWRLADVARKRGEAETVFVRGNRSLYREVVSDRIMAIIARGADAFEEASIAEAYVDLSSLGGMEGAEGHVRGLKGEILAQEGLTCSVGIGPNKLVAKIASDFRKPDGLTVVRPEAVQAFLDPLRIRVIPGIGPKTEASLHGKGINTIADLRGVELAELTTGFGKWGGALWQKARGMSEDPVSNEWERKSVGEQETFEEDTLDAAFVLARARLLAGEVYRRLVAEGFQAFRTVTVTVRFAGFVTRSRSHTGTAPFRSEGELQGEVRRLLEPFFDARENPKAKKIRLVGVRVERLLREDRRGRLSTRSPSRRFDEGNGPASVGVEAGTVARSPRPRVRGVGRLSRGRMAGRTRVYLAALALMGVGALAGALGTRAMFKLKPAVPTPAMTEAARAEIAALRERLMAHVRTLGGQIGERNVFRPAGLEAAAGYIRHVWSAQGFSVREEPYEVRGQRCANLVVEVAGSGRGHELVLVGAHYDSVRGSPGANDNATGVAVLLELARALRSASPPRTLRLVAFVNEEPPFFQTEQMGSRRHARQARLRGEAIVAMISLETLGAYFDAPGSQTYPFPLSAFYPRTGNYLGVVGNLRSRALVREIVTHFMAVTDFPIEAAATVSWIPGVDWSDHWAFWKAGYPAVMLTDTALYRYAEYHSAADRPEVVNAREFARAAHGIIETVRRLVGAP